MESQNEKFIILDDLTQEENQKLNYNLQYLVHQFIKNQALDYSCFVPILGKCPVIPDTPDNDARLEAWNDKAEYASKVLAIEEFIEKKYLQTKRCN